MTFGSVNGSDSPGVRVTVEAETTVSLLCLECIAYARHTHKTSFDAQIFMLEAL